MAKYVIGTIDEIPPGKRKVVDVGGRSIGVFNLNGEFFALRNSCPHQGGALCEGRIGGFVISESPGVYEYSRQGEILRCPWHGWEFDIRTGQSWFDPAKVRVRRYAVTIEPETTVATEEAPAGSGPQPGPYVAETYEVFVERHNIVVELPG